VKGTPCALLLILAFPLAGCGSPATPTPPTPGPTTSPTSPSGFDYNGITHVSWWHDEYLGAEARDSRRRLAATRSSWAAVIATWYMDRRDSDEIGPDLLRTPTDDAVAQAIQDLHDLGLKVMLKPHVDVQDGTWRGSISPLDKERWFASYRAFIGRYAALAQAGRAEMFCVGTELATLTDSRYAAPWAGVVGSVRAAYRGPITYAANANAPGDEFTSVSFWDSLDLMGLDVYTPLTDKDDPSRLELAQGWFRNRYGQNMVAAFKNWQASRGKPVIFTEIGYRSAAGTNRAPYDYSTASRYDPGEQADCYAAAFQVWSLEARWMKGVFWWDWAVPAPGPQDTDYTPREKPAENVLRLWVGS
jgi:hypothetical protein